jgi:hypothetical protein
MDAAATAQTSTLSDSQGTISLALPQREGKEGVLGSFLIARNELFRAILLSEGINNSRIEYGIRALIGYIDEDKFRKELYQRFSDRCAEIQKSEGTASDKQSRTLNESIFVIGELTSYFDRCIGLSHKLEVVPL